MTDKTVKSIICDSCEVELIVNSSYPANYSLELRVINTGINTTGVEYGVSIYPPLSSTLHFCGLGCLGTWLAKDQKTN